MMPNKGVTRRPLRRRSALHLAIATVLFGVGAVFLLPLASAQGSTVAGIEDDTEGVFMYAAGLSGAGCTGTPAGAQTDEIINAAASSGALTFLGTSAADILGYTAGTSAETPVVGEVDTTNAEVITGLSAIDDFGQFSNGDDDLANADIGTGGSLTVRASTTSLIVVPDGDLATGVLGVGADGVDGAEIFILEDAELSGLDITLTGPDATVSFTVDDYQLNPTTSEGSDDIVIAIDLDSLRGWTGIVDQITLTDEGRDAGAIESCAGTGTLDSSAEIDAILARRIGVVTPNPDVVIEKTTNGAQADLAPGPQIQVGTPITWEYVVYNVGNVDLENIVVTDNQETGIVCTSSTDNQIALLGVGRSAVCQVSGTATLGQYANIATVTADGVGTTLTATDTDPSHYTGFVSSTGTIGDTVYVDVDGSGTQNGTEGGIAGVTVTLAGPASGTAVTDSNGNYVFTMLPPGSYTVTVDTATLPSLGWIGTADLNGPVDGVSTETLVEGETATGHDFGFAPPLSVRIEASTNGADADNAPGITLQTGTPITWTYLVQNTSDAEISSFTVNDSQLGAVTCPTGSIAPGTTITCTATGTATLGSYSSIGTVSASGPGGQIAGDTDPTNYTGVAVPVFSLGDQVWIDLNSNGSRDLGEPGIEGATVSLTGPGGPLSTVTDASGQYLFGGLADGTYQVTVSNLPVGFTATSDPDGGADSTATATIAGGDNLVQDFAFSPQASVSVSKTTNGLDAAVAPGPSIILGTQTTWVYEVVNTGVATLANLIVTDDQESGIDCGSGTNTIASLQAGQRVTCSLVGTATTTGQYRNVVIVDGNVDGVAVIDVTATDASHYFGIADNAGFIGDRIWLDGNGNGIQDNGEAGLSGVVVALWTANTSGTPLTEVTQVTSGSNGDYGFPGLSAGNYVVQIVPTAAQVLTAANAGGDDAADSDIDPNTGLSATIPLQIGQTIDTVDAGIVPQLAELSGVVWSDTNADGLRVSEAGLGTLTVELWSVTGTGAPGVVVDSTTTGPAGGWAFTGVAPNLDWYIKVTGPAGSSFSPANVGTNDTIDSDVSAAGLVLIENLGAGEQRTGVDAGIIDGVVGATATPTLTPTTTPATPTAVPATATATAQTPTPTSSPTATPDAGAATATPVPATATPTATTDPAATATATAAPATVTATVTSTPATTSTPVITSTPVATTAPTATPLPTGDALPFTGTVFADADNDGVRDAGEAGRAGVEIAIWEVDGDGNLVTLVATDTTDEEGFYSVLGLRVNRPYRLVTILPAGTLLGASGPDNSTVLSSGISAPFTIGSDGTSAPVTVGVVGAAAVAPTATAAPAVVVVTATPTVVPAPAPAPATATPTPVPATTPIAVTGSDSGLAAFIGLTLISAGAVLLVARRRVHR